MTTKVVACKRLQRDFHSFIINNPFQMRTPEEFLPLKLPECNFTFISKFSYYFIAFFFTNNYSTI